MQTTLRHDEQGATLEEAFERYVDTIVSGFKLQAGGRDRFATSREDARRLAFRLLKTPLFGKYMVAWEWPQAADPAHWEPVTIPSASRSLLAGRFGSAYGRTKGVVVCAHPMRRSAKGYFLSSGRADMLRRNGYDVLLFDFNGFGESPHGNFKYPLDVLAAGAFARELAGGLPVHVLAASFGAGWTLCAAAHAHPFDSIAVEGAFTTPQEFYARTPCAKLVLNVLWRMFPRTAPTMVPLDAVERLSGRPRVLFIGCQADVKTVPAMTRRLFDRCNLPRTAREIWLVENAGHIRAYETQPADFERRVVGFFDAAAAL